MAKSARQGVKLLVVLCVLSSIAQPMRDASAQTAQRWTIVEHDTWELVSGGPVELRPSVVRQEGAPAESAMQSYCTHGEFSLQNNGILMHLGLGHLRMGKYAVIESTSGLLHTKDQKAVAALLLVLDNTTKLPVELDWDNVCLVAPNLKSCRIIHSGVDLMHKDESMSPTVIQPGSRVVRFIFPPHLLFYEQGKWMATHFFEEVAPGQSIGLSIPLRRGQAGDHVRIVIRRQDEQEKIR